MNIGELMNIQQCSLHFQQMIVKSSCDESHAWLRAANGVENKPWWVDPSPSFWHLTQDV